MLQAALTQSMDSVDTLWILPPQSPDSLLTRWVNDDLNPEFEIKREAEKVVGKIVPCLRCTHDLGKQMPWGEYKVVSVGIAPNVDHSQTRSKRENFASKFAPSSLRLVLF